MRGRGRMGGWEEQGKSERDKEEEGWGDSDEERGLWKMRGKGRGWADERGMKDFAGKTGIGEGRRWEGGVWHLSVLLLIRVRKQVCVCVCMYVCVSVCLSVSDQPLIWWTLLNESLYSAFVFACVLPVLSTLPRLLGHQPSVPRLPFSAWFKHAYQCSQFPLPTACSSSSVETWQPMARTATTARRAWLAEFPALTNYRRWLKG